MLWETRSVFEDQVAAVEEASKRRGKEHIDLSLLLDGLSSEREQGITIDVAYRYMSTERRSFIIADTPGHEQYTRNMVTGMSTSDLAVLLVDARKGLLTQTKRHATLAALLGVRHIVLAVNKMDLVDWDRGTYDSIVADFVEFAGKLRLSEVIPVPVSALTGGNVTEREKATPWYQGPTLLGHLNTVHLGSTHNYVDLRFPVQSVIRPDLDFRGYAGSVASGTVRVGDEIAVLPSGQRSTISRIVTYDGDLVEAGPDSAVTICLADEIDVSRGDVIVRVNNRPELRRRFDAMLCWMDETPLEVGKRYRLRHGTREVWATVESLNYELDVNTLSRANSDELGINGIGRATLRASGDLPLDTYQTNRRMGAFILIDPASNMTACAGMVRRTVSQSPDGARQKSPGVVMEATGVELDSRVEAFGHGPAVVWLTGLSGSGKSTIARHLEQRLLEEGVRAIRLDGDILRHGLNGDLGFSAEDRRENIRRVGEMAKVLHDQGIVVICSFISPYRVDRNRVRSLVPEGAFIEVHIDCPAEVCAERDTKGLWAKAMAGEIENFTGVSAPYEAPSEAEIRIDTTSTPADTGAGIVLDAILNRIR